MGMKRRKKPTPEEIQKPVHASTKKKELFHIEFLNSVQKKCWETIQDNDIVFLLGSAGSGKTFLSTAYSVYSFLRKETQKIMITRPIVEAGASMGYLPGPQPLTAKLLTSSGWTTMGQIKLGDRVIGRDGIPTEVVGVYPKGKKDIYKITTTDGTSTECCLDHLWYTHTAEDKKRSRKGSIKSTEELLKTLKTDNDKINHFLPRNEAVHYDKKELYLSPYVLGVLLGDGCLSHNISFSNTDQELIDRVGAELVENKCFITNNGKNITYNIRSNIFNNKTARKVKLTDIETGSYKEYNSIGAAVKESDLKLNTFKTRCNRNSTIKNIKYEFLSKTSRWSNPVKDIIENLGLSRKKAYDKFIPNEYKYSSISDRLDLLRGLMDCDGTVKITGEASYTTVSKRLASDVIELVRSLGGRATLRKRNRAGKQSKLADRVITSRYPSYEFTISLPEKMNPFYISRKSKRFSSKYIHRVGIASIEKVGHEEVQCIKVDSSEHLYLTDDFIVTHNTADEKLHPYMLPIYDTLDELVGTEGPQRMALNKSLEIAPINFLRGRTAKRSVFILDEAQNCTYTQLKLFLTRIGEGSKLIVTGDPKQSDLPGKIAVMEIVEKLKGVKGIGIVELPDSSIVRHPLISAIVERI